MMVKQIKFIESDGYANWYSITIDDGKWVTTSEYGFVIATNQLVDSASRPLHEGDYEARMIRRAFQMAELRGEV